MCAHSLYTPLCNVMDTLSLYVCVSTAPPVSVLLYSCTFIFFGQNPLSVLSSLPPSLPPPLYIQHILLLINPLKLFDLITLISLLSLLSLCLSVFPVSLLSLSPLPLLLSFPLLSGESDEERRRPVIIHRAILGSVERIIAVLTESYGGKW